MLNSKDSLLASFIFFKILEVCHGLETLQMYKKPFY